ncbi:MAG: heavy metal translocating P-type ATPase, partial [Micrococcales bacterium]
MTAPEDASVRRELDLAITGMTCAACANRVERKLNKLAHVDATVNYATAKATVTVPADLDPQQLIDVVHATGYGAMLAQPGHRPGGEDRTAGETAIAAEGAGARHAAEMRRRVLICAALSVPVIVL